MATVASGAGGALGGLGSRVLACAALWAALAVPALAMGSRPPPVDDKQVAMAVLGDSNSLSFQDHVSLTGKEQRGGAYRARTFQWGEVIARLRGNEVDPGPWEVSGVSSPWLRWLDTVGWPIARAPRKEDYRYNFANEGSQCAEMMSTRRRQAPRLVALMDKDPKRWENGVVVIRIGTNDMNDDVTNQASRDPQAPVVRGVVQACMEQIGDAVALIRKTHPTTRIVLVGAFDYSNHVRNVPKWQSRSELDNIARMADDFDNGLKKIIAANPGMAFFDERKWFRDHLGGRDANGKPAYKTLQIGPNLRVTHAMGDAPSNTMLADFHNGLVWNTLWAQSMVQLMHDDLKLPITPIGDEEVVRFIRSLTDER